MSEIFYTADTHFFHPRIIELCNRPYDDVEAMNAGLLGKLVAMGSEDDELWVLGDFIMGKRSETIPAIMDKLRPAWKSVHLLPGNHDHCHPSNKRAGELTALYEDNGITVEPPMMRVRLGGQPVTLCHFPPSGDAQDKDRFIQWRPELGQDEWLLHGHVHDLWARKGKWLNVGVDKNDGWPVSQDLIAKEVKKIETATS